MEFGFKTTTTKKARNRESVFSLLLLLYKIPGVIHSPSVISDQKQVEVCLCH